MAVAVGTERSFSIRFKAAREGRQSIKERSTKDIPLSKGGNKQKKANQNQSFQDGEASGKSLGQEEDGFFFIEGFEIVSYSG